MRVCGSACVVASRIAAKAASNRLAKAITVWAATMRASPAAASPAMRRKVTAKSDGGTSMSESGARNGGIELLPLLRGGVDPPAFERRGHARFGLMDVGQYAFHLVAER